MATEAAAAADMAYTSSCSGCGMHVQRMHTNAGAPTAKGLAESCSNCSSLCNMCKPIACSFCEECEHGPRRMCEACAGTCDSCKRVACAACTAAFSSCSSCGYAVCEDCRLTSGMELNTVDIEQSASDNELRGCWCAPPLRSASNVRHISSQRYHMAQLHPSLLSSSMEAAGLRDADYGDDGDEDNNKFDSYEDSRADYVSEEESDANAAAKAVRHHQNHYKWGDPLEPAVLNLYNSLLNGDSAVGSASLDGSNVHSRYQGYSTLHSR